MLQYFKIFQLFVEKKKKLEFIFFRFSKVKHCLSFKAWIDNSLVCLKFLLFVSRQLKKTL